MEVGDFGQLEAAVAQSRTTVFGQDAYPDLVTKAAALPQSLVRNRGLVDGNSRIAWAAAWALLKINGIPLDQEVDVDAAETLVLAAARGESEVAETADGLRGCTTGSRS